MGDRYYTAGTVEALFMLSRGHCYEPSCRARVMTRANDAWQITVHIAHIKGLKWDSARHDPDMTDRERNHFRNLLLLCKPHHTVVDNKANEHLYEEDELLQWKRDVEGDYADDLDQLDWLTEEKLQTLMASAVSTTQRVIFTAIENVKDIGAETLQLVKSFVSESISRPYLDADTAASLEYSARVFERLPDHAELLYMSSRDLRGLPDSSEILYHSSRGLREVTDHAETLHYAARSFSEFQGSIPQLVDAAHSLRLSMEMIEGARFAADRVRDALSNSSDLQDLADQLDQNSQRLVTAAALTREAPSDWSWNSFRWGMGVCLVVVITILALWATGTARV